jgi:hypothetical protein
MSMPAVLSSEEVEKVGGALAPLVVWALWTGGAVVVGLGAAYVATHFR